jgi:hypothetical protein
MRAWASAFWSAPIPCKIAALSPAFAISLTSASPKCRCLSQDLFDDFGAELAGGQHEDRLKAGVIEHSR